ncbi:bifunctional DNA primase/polymerase, partial [Gordonia sp. NPDC057258]
MSLAEAAEAYAGSGLRIFPLAPRTKDRPIVSFSTGSSSDIEQVREWWTRNPDYGIGVHGHEKVPTGGQVEVPAGGQIKVPTLCSSCR